MKNSRRDTKSQALVFEPDKDEEKLKSAVNEILDYLLGIENLPEKFKLHAIKRKLKT